MFRTPQESFQHDLFIALWSRISHLLSPLVVASLPPHLEEIPSAKAEQDEDIQLEDDS